MVNAVTGTQLATSHDMFLAAYRGRPSDAIPLVSTTVADAVTHGEGWPVQIAEWSTAVLYNGLGQYEDAVAVAEKACEETYMVLGPQVALPELIEAASKNRQVDTRRGCDGAPVGDDGDHGLGLGCGHRCTRTSVGERQRDRRALVRRVDRVPRVNARFDQSSPEAGSSTESGFAEQTVGSTRGEQLLYGARRVRRDGR